MSYPFIGMDRARILIIGGGVVGCAVAYAVSRRWQDVFLVEQLPRLGMATSSRNSGVIHSGIYYPPGTLKAQLCPEGNRLMYEFCAKHNVPHRRTGKLIVASDSREEKELHALLARGRANGVEGLRLIGPAEIRAREPHIVGTAAIDVPSAGIVSAEDLVKTFARVAALPHIRGFIAGASRSWPRCANAASETRLSAAPPASLASVLAVSGATTNKSA